MAKHKKIDILKKNKFPKIKLIGDLASDFSKTDVIECKIELRFNKEAIVEECKGVMDYSEDRIALNVKGGMVVFEGSALCLHSFEDSTAVIRGQIVNIGYEI